MTRRARVLGGIKDSAGEIQISRLAKGAGAITKRVATISDGGDGPLEQDLGPASKALARCDCLESPISSMEMGSGSSKTTVYRFPAAWTFFLGLSNN